MFHEELAVQWLVCHPVIKPRVLRNAWFFFELLIKTMAQYLSRAGKLAGNRRDRFSSSYMKELENLVGMLAQEICEKHIKDGNYARSLNASLAFFIHDSFSLMDRGFVFTLIKTYLKKVRGGGRGEEGGRGRGGHSSLYSTEYYYTCTYIHVYIYTIMYNVHACFYTVCVPA